ncbi:MAG: GxxExxY protein [Holophaga sp.]
MIPEELIHHQDTKHTKEAPRKDLGEVEERVAATIVDSAIQVHKALGPGLLESVYERCLEFELQQRGLLVEHQRTFPITYRSLHLESGLRLDLLIENLAVVELKTVERILPIHEAQLITYLRISGKRLGFLLNFNVPLMKDGISRKIL